MKKALSTLLILASTISIAHADRYPGRDRDPRMPGGDILRDLRECSARNEVLRQDNLNLSNSLRACELSRGDRRRSEELERENTDLKNQVGLILTENSNLKNQVNGLLNENADIRRQNDNMRIDISRLEDELRRRDERDNRDRRRDEFDLAQSIMACSKINNASYSQQCATSARTMYIKASVIEQCAKLSNAYYASECVKSAGLKNTNAKQVEACLGIKNDSYAQQCVSIAGEKQVKADVIQSCVLTSSNAYYQVQCVSNM